MKMEMRQKIEKRDIAVIGASAFGGFLFVLIVFLILSKDVATALLVGLLLGAPGGAGGGVLACLLPRKFVLGLFLEKSFREYSNAQIRAYLIAGTIFAGLIGFSTFGGTQSGWLLWPLRFSSIYVLAVVWCRSLREYRRRKRGEAP
jgi:hypothetical protein